MVHSSAGCPRSSGEAYAGARSRACTALFLFLLENVTQGALAGSHRVLDWGAKETVGSSVPATWNELDGCKSGDKKEKDRSLQTEENGKEKVRKCWSEREPCFTFELLALRSS